MFYFSGTGGLNGGVGVLDSGSGGIGILWNGPGDSRCLPSSEY